MAPLNPRYTQVRFNLISIQVCAKIPLGPASGSRPDSDQPLMDVHASIQTYCINLGTCFQAFLWGVIMAPLDSRYTLV